MNTSDLRTRAAVLLLLPFAGMTALLLGEVVHLLGETPFNADHLPPVDMIMIALCLSALPVLLLAFFTASITRWVAFGIAALMTLFHGLHIMEHLGGGDYVMGSLIVFTMFLPSLFGALLVWRAKQGA